MCVCVCVCVCILAVTAQLFTNATKTNMYSFDRLLAMSIWIIICKTKASFGFSFAYLEAIEVAQFRLLRSNIC